MSGLAKPSNTLLRGEQRRSAQEFWKRYFDFYDTLNESIPYVQTVERHVELLQPTAGDLVLDAGTGTGNLAVLLIKRGAQVTGIDFCEAALEKCRKKAPQGDFRFGDLTQRLDFEDGRFDKIASCNVIYTLPPDAQGNAVRELYRILRPGGIAVITVFGVGFRALNVYLEALRLQREQTGFVDAVLRSLRYSVATVRILYYVARIKRRERTGEYTFFTREQLKDLIESAGFKVELMEPIFASQCLIARARKPAEGDDREQLNAG